MPLGRGADEHVVAGFGQDDEVAAGDDRLAVAVATALPLQLAGRRVDARQDRFVEAV